MKRLIGAFSALILAAFVVCPAEAATDWDSAASLKRVNTIGTKLLTANKLPSNIEFKVSDEDTINAYTNINQEIYVYRGLLENVENDDELAAVIAHEMGHIINGHCAKQSILNSVISSINPNVKTAAGDATVQVAKSLSASKISRNDEIEADLTAVDLLMTAGYNPLALISVLNKICGNYVDILQSHPSGEKRLMAIFDYANYNYPAKVKANYKTDSYQKALQLIYANLKIRNASPKKLAQAKKEQEKLQEKKLKRARNMAKSSNPWSTSYSMLQLLSTPSGT